MVGLRQMLSGTLAASMLLALLSPIAGAVPEPARGLAQEATWRCYDPLIAEGERKETQVATLLATGRPPYPLPTGLDPTPFVEAAVDDTLVALPLLLSPDSTTCIAEHASAGSPPDILGPLGEFVDPLIPQEPDCDLGLCE